MDKGIENRDGQDFANWHPDTRPTSSAVDGAWSKIDRGQSAARRAQEIETRNRVQEAQKLAEAIAFEGEFTTEEIEEMRGDLVYLKDIRKDFKDAGEVVGNLSSKKYSSEEKKWLTGRVTESGGSKKMLIDLDEQISGLEISLQRRDLIVASRKKKAA